LQDVIIIKQAKKGFERRKKNNQNKRNIYVLPFKTMEIMANYSFFIHMNINEFKPKIHLINL
jgi:hypothetical protein